MWCFLLFAASLVAVATTQQDGFIPMVHQQYPEKVNSDLQQLVAFYLGQELTYKAYASYYDRADVALPGFRHFFTSLSEEALSRVDSLTSWMNERGGIVRYQEIQLKDECEVIGEELMRVDITRATTGDAPAGARKLPLICEFLVETTAVDKKPEKDKKSYLQKKKSQTLDRALWQHGLYGLEDVLAMERVAISEVTRVRNRAKDFCNSAHGLQSVPTSSNQDEAPVNFCDPATRHKLEHNYLLKQVDSAYRVAQLLERLQKHQNLDSYILEEYLLDEELQ